MFEAIESQVEDLGGHVVETEVIGMLPDELLLSAAASRLKLAEAAPGRMLTRRVLEYVVTRASDEIEER